VFGSQTQEESPFVLDASTLTNGRGEIVFNGNKMSPRKRRFWILEKAGTVKFTMENNNLKLDSRITISGLENTKKHDSKEFLDEVYIK